MQCGGSAEDGLSDLKMRLGQMNGQSPPGTYVRTVRSLIDPDLKITLLIVVRCFETALLFCGSAA